MTAATTTRQATGEHHLASTATSTARQPRARSGREPGVFLGVDTHQRTHHAAVIDAHHRRLGDREFPATTTGYRDLLAWARAHGPIAAVGVESTGSYGAGLATFLLAHLDDPDHPRPRLPEMTGLTGLPEGVFEVNRPAKTTRARHGKSDTIDAYSAAEQVLAGQVTGRPKVKTGVVEAIRNLKVPRDAAVKDRTRAYHQLRDLITTAPPQLREELLPLTSLQRTARAAALRPDPTKLAEPLHAARYAMRTLARRIKALTAEINETDKLLATLVKKTAPTLIAMPQVGTQTAAQFIITAGENPERMTSEATFAKLAGVAPLPASSGKTNRHRLNRGGDRQANCALHLVIVGRMKSHSQTRAYVERRRAENKTNPEIIRCLKRHLARSIYKALRTDLITT